MGIGKSLKKIRDDYVIRQVKQLHFPEFNTGQVVRRHVIFSGRVQKIGFRLEIYELAKRLDLTGWVINRADKSVEAQLQGEYSKIVYLVNFMKSLKRASVRKVTENELEVVTDESGFIIIKDK